MYQLVTFPAKAQCITENGDNASSIPETLPYLQFKVKSNKPTIYNNIEHALESIAIIVVWFRPNYSLIGNAEPYGNPTQANYTVN